MKQSYSKPIVTRVELRAEEALLSTCKTADFLSTQAYDLGGLVGCNVVLSACRDLTGS